MLPKLIKRCFTTGGKLVHDSLIKNKVENVWMYSGGAIMPVVDAFSDSPMNYYITCHEQSLGHAATGYAKSSGKTGVAIVTSGPGLTNMVTPILDANNDSTPLVVLSGQVPINAINTNAFQECPATDITKSITKFSYCVQNAEEIPEVMDYAFHVANNGKKGAVHIDLPKCVTSKKIGNKNTFTNNLFNIDRNEKDVPLDMDEIYKVCKVINNSKKPIFYIGQGCANAYEELRIIAKKANIPVTTTLHGMGIMDELSPLSLKMCGMHGSYWSNMALQNADCIIAVGARFDDRTTGNIDEYAPIARKHGRNGTGGIIHCNIEYSEINKVLDTDYNFNCDAKKFLQVLSPKIKETSRDKWLENINQWKNKNPFMYDKLPGGKLKTQSVLKKLDEHIKTRNDIIVTTGVGNHQMMSCQHLTWRYPKRIISSGSLGVMGSSIGYAIGAQVANPNKTIISVDGDGSFNMTSNELATIRRYNLPIKIAIINDHSMSMVRTWEHLFFGKRYIATDCVHNPDYVMLAKSNGIPAFTCDNYETMNETIKKMLSIHGPVLVDFRVLGEPCFPLVSPGKALDNMVLSLEDTVSFDLKNVMAPS